ncbi:MAG: phosphatase PAP2 family protein [Burkholderiaceae bacterium]|nr:phosphatase PAP2 family protein [Burkholderiaceae bacterium]
MTRSTPPLPRPSGRPAPTLALALSLLLAGCQTPPPTLPEQVGEFRANSGYLRGYLDRKALPDSLALLPPPPADGSPARAADLARHQATRALKDTPRWQQAARDANLKWPAAADTLACAMGLTISQQATPHLNMLLRRSLLDAGLATYGAKDRYQRQRPFAALDEATCTPAEEASLRKDGSYPSGHAALGWAWALVLTQVSPERGNALLARGLAFGDSRVVCGVHWQSDVEAGRVIGAAAVARLQSDALFQAQLAAARTEVEAARAAGAQPPAHCAAEAAALAAGR